MIWKSVRISYGKLDGCDMEDFMNIEEFIDMARCKWTSSKQSGLWGTSTTSAVNKTL